MIVSACLCIGWADSWESIRAAADSVDAVSADFVQEKHLPILARPLVSKGKLAYRRPDSLRWEYVTPVKSILVLHEGNAQRLVQTDRGMVADDSVRLQAMQFVMPEIGAWLSGRFEDNSLFTATLLPDRRISLQPQDAGMARFIQRIELQLADRPGEIEQVTIFEGEEAFTRMVFSQTRINPDLDDRLFRVDP
jgi:outer membrane lipoprotein-sorting protein